jgi:hypothetical protein
MSHNPYSPPGAPMGPPNPMPNPYGLPSCPQCQSPNVSKPGFTWWGGILGPKLLNHHVCSACGFGFNGTTGKSNSTAIGIYLAVGLGLGVLIVILRVAAG